jgi:hypothetical protein
MKKPAFEFTPTDMLRAVADIVDAAANHRIANSEAYIAIKIADYIIDGLKGTVERGTVPSQNEAYPKYLELMALWDYAKSREIN